MLINGFFQRFYCLLLLGKTIFLWIFTNSRPLAQYRAHHPYDTLQVTSLASVIGLIYPSGGSGSTS